MASAAAADPLSVNSRGRMLVFAVLMDRTGLTKRQSGIVVVHKPEHQLPLAVVTFEKAPYFNHLDAVPFCAVGRGPCSCRVGGGGRPPPTGC